MIAAARLSMRTRAEHLRRQRDERWLDSRGFLGKQANPFVDEVGIEAVAQGDVCDGDTGFRTLLNDLGLERFAVGTALRAHGKSA